MMSVTQDSQDREPRLQLVAMAAEIHAVHDAVKFDFGWDRPNS
jgi:hypothetical protein